ncbi:MAG: Rieske 2Fe-2S domain-containing protein [Roseococcus sp.]|nr:Rieske 2Fe-2S domain-containing protein [Roseococcus sp.]
MATELHLRALHDADAFAEEQARLGQVWTLVGYASDLPRENSWFRAVLGGRSVFIQRFAEGLRGFENRCAHRSYPLRTTEKGEGPILCGFHHWRYDSEGLATGIPNCQDAFGTTPRELDRRLQHLDVACCGELIFARFPGRPESLETFLGPLFEVLSLLCTGLGRGHRATLPGRMNWRLSQWISMDDYHLAAVHPRSLGTGRRYLQRTDLGYHRHGMHSAFFRGVGAGTVEEWLADLRRGDASRGGYRIFHLFPNAGISFIPALPVLPGRSLPFAYVVLQRHVPVSVDRTELEVMVAPAARPRRYSSRLLRILAPFEWFRIPLVRRSALRVLREDQVICENLQKAARQIADDPILGAAEIRVAWFNEAYAEAMRAAEPPP